MFAQTGADAGSHQGTVDKREHLDLVSRALLMLCLNLCARPTHASSTKMSSRPNWCRTFSRVQKLRHTTIKAREPKTHMVMTSSGPLSCWSIFGEIFEGSMRMSSSSRKMLHECNGWSRDTAHAIIDPLWTHGHVVTCHQIPVSALKGGLIGESMSRIEVSTDRLTKVRNRTLCGAVAVSWLCEPWVLLVWPRPK